MNLEERAELRTLNGLCQVDGGLALGLHSFLVGCVDLLVVGDARVGAGRIEMMVGDNGAGKSTLVSVICGLAKENRGTIAIDGASPRS